MKWKKKSTKKPDKKSTSTYNEYNCLTKQWITSNFPNKKIEYTCLYFFYIYEIGKIEKIISRKIKTELRGIPNSSAFVKKNQSGLVQLHLFCSVGAS